MIDSTPNAVFHGETIDPEVRAVTVNIARAGTLPSQITYDFLNTILDPRVVRQDHFVMARVLDDAAHVTGAKISGSKIGGDVDDAILLFPDPMGATGGSMCTAIDAYKKDVVGKPAEDHRRQPDRHPGIPQAGDHHASRGDHLRLARRPGPLAGGCVRHRSGNAVGPRARARRQAVHRPGRRRVRRDHEQRVRLTPGAHLKLAQELEQMLSAEEIARRVRDLGRQIERDYQGKDLVLLGVLKGSYIFISDLTRAIDLPLSVDFIGLSSYGEATEASGVVKITSDVSKPIENKHVLIVEDIVDTGLTMRYLLDNLATRHPASVKLCTLLHKPGRSRTRDPHRLSRLPDQGSASWSGTGSTPATSTATSPSSAFSGMAEQSAPRRGGGLQRFVLWLVILALLAAVWWLASERNEHHFRVAAQGSALVIERGRFFPTGTTAMPASDKAYAPVAIPAGENRPRTRSSRTRTRSTAGCSICSPAGRRTPASAATGKRRRCWSIAPALCPD